MNAPKPSHDVQAALKKEAAEYAVRYIASGMTVGLGTGSTAIFAIRHIGACCKSGELKNIIGFATSKDSWDAAVELNIPMLTEDLPKGIDVTIDGADEVDPQLNLIKGGGGALLREKLVAQATAARNHRCRRKQVVGPPGNPACAANRGAAVRVAITGAFSRVAGCEVCSPANGRRQGIPHRSGQSHSRLRLWADRRPGGTGTCARGSRRNR